MKPHRKKFNFRGFISSFLGIAGLVLLLSGVVLYIAPPGRIAHWVNWTFLVLTREQWIALHTVLSFLFAGLAVWHLAYNWRPFLHYLRQKGASWPGWRREFGAALGTVTVIGVLSVAQLPPASLISNLGQAMSARWEVPGTGPVVPHAELLTLPAYAKAAGIPMQQVQDRLAGLGVTPAPDASLREVARMLDISPMTLAGLLDAGHTSTTAHPTPRTVPDAAGLTLEAFSRRSGVPMRRIRQRLSYNGYSCRDSDRIADIARELACDPDELVALFLQPPRSDASLKP